MDKISSDVLAKANAQSRRLRELIRAPEILIMPGAYDALSARIYQQLGAKAIQCSSGGIAAGLGYPDGEVLSREQTLEATRRIAETVSVPVNADGERGYADAKTIGETVRGFIEAGAAGMNLEDSDAHGPGQPMTLVPLSRHMEKVKALLEARRTLGSEFFLNARVDALMAMRDDPQAALREAVKRGQAFAEAGADCVFFMAAVSREVIATLVKEVPAPVSVLAGPRTPPARELQELGVARVSYGYAFTLAAAGAMRRLAQEVLQEGTLTSLQDAMSMPDLAKLVER